MGNVREEIAKNLLFFRKTKKATQKDLADYLGVNNSAVSNWEKGLNSIDIDTLHKACVFLGVSVNDMFGGFANLNDASFTSEEIAMIFTFRKLDQRGKNAVCYTVAKEYEYIKNARPLKEQTDDDAYILPVAARSGEQVSIKTTKTRIEADIAKLKPSDEEDL